MKTKRAARGAFRTRYVVYKCIFTTAIVTSIVFPLMTKNAMSMPASRQIACGLSRGRLYAQFGRTFSFRKFRSLVFKVYDRNKHRLLTEVVPVSSVKPLIGVFVYPLNVDRRMKDAVSVECVSSSTLGTAERCPQSTTVDDGVYVKIAEMEISNRTLYVSGTVAHKMLGAQVIGLFHSDLLALRSSNLRVQSSITLNGFDPQPFRLHSPLGDKVQQNVSLRVAHVGEPPLWICISGRDTAGDRRRS